MQCPSHPTPGAGEQERAHERLLDQEARLAAATALDGDRAAQQVTVDELHESRRRSEEAGRALQRYCVRRLREAKATAARKRAALKAEAGAALANGGGGGSAAAAAPAPPRSRASKSALALQDWTQLLNHANQAALTETWELPPEELFLRILAQINRSKRDILQEKYNQCRDPSTTAATRSVFIRVLKRIAESFMACLHTMQTGRQGVVLPQQPQRGISA